MLDIARPKPHTSGVMPDAQRQRAVALRPAPCKQYLFVFCYQTPRQRAQASAQGEPEESSQGVFIEAESSERALDWGREIAEQFVRTLYADNAVSWKSLNFTHWIESDPKAEYPSEILERLPIVPAGTYPVFEKS